MDIHKILTVAIISYNTSEKLRICLKSIQAHLPFCKMIVWDNCSEDDTGSMVSQQFPNVELINSSENLLFAEGCNHLIQHCKSKFVLLMNADTFLEDDQLLEILPFMDGHEDLVAVSPAVKDAGRIRHLAHGTITPSLAIARDSVFGKLLRRTQWYRKAMLGDISADEIFYAPKITNCCCIIRREDFLTVGGFNPGQLLYWTEEDFSLRVAEAGYRQAVYGKSRVVHEHGSSTATLPRSLLRGIFVRDRIFYMRRNYGLVSTVLVELAIFFRPKIWYSIYDYRCFLMHTREMNRMAKVVELYRNLRT